MEADDRGTVAMRGAGSQQPLGFVDLVAHLTDMDGSRRRFVFGLAGPPGSGKSTVR